MRYLPAIAICFFMISAAAQKVPVFPFKKLTGKWMSEKKASGAVMGEVWEKRNDNSMAGKSFMIKNGDTAILETVDLVKEGNDIFYIPVAYGQNDDKPVRFKLTSATESVYIFENPQHDFPKRIVYDFTASEILHAYIDDGTEKKRQHYYYTKQ